MWRVCDTSSSVGTTFSERPSPHDVDFLPIPHKVASTNRSNSNCSTTYTHDLFPQDPTRPPLIKNVLSPLQDYLPTPGTLLYMAPEALHQPNRQHGEKSLNTSVDVWSMGVILYQLMFGKTPHDSIRDLGVLNVGIAIADPRTVIKFDEEELARMKERIVLDLTEQVVLLAVGR